MAVTDFSTSIPRDPRRIPYAETPPMNHWQRWVTPPKAAKSEAEAPAEDIAAQKQPAPALSLSIAAGAIRKKQERRPEAASVSFASPTDTRPVTIPAIPMGIPAKRASSATLANVGKPAALSKFSDDEKPRVVTKPRILIVEDDRAQALFAQSILHGAGIESDVQMDSSRVIDSMISSPPDLILLDLHMPGLDGMNLTTQIRKHPNLQSIPIVLLTGDHDPELPVIALDNGIDDFLNKPIQPRHLIATVSNRIKRARQQAAAITPPPSVSTPKARLIARAHLLQRIDDMLQHDCDRNAALLYVDMDGTETLRSRYGFAIFERLMSEVGQRMANYVSPHQVARLSDDSLLVLATQIETDNLQVYAQQLNQRIGTFSFLIRGDEIVKLSSAIGCCSLAHSFSEANAVLEAAERCVQQARQLPDRVEVYLPPAPNQVEKEEVPVIFAEEEVELSFQPIASVAGNDHAQYQVLPRIRTPKGLLSSLDLSPMSADMAERFADADPTVIHRAIALIVQYQEAGKTLKLFIPQAIGTLARRSYRHWLLKEVSSRGINASSLIIDLNLDEALADTVLLQDICRELISARIQFCLNQYEPVPEAAALLTQLPLSFIRLSRRFAELHRDAKLAAELRDLVISAHNLGLLVIGQQVENPQAAATMWLGGIDFIQGDLIHSAGKNMDFEFQEFNN
jgi:PleD family two-component response regulator/EAL domain-containing protein (putative c-di-GMP-specific phosphodiesterase class I)